MNAETERREDHPVDGLLVKALRDDAPGDVRQQLMQRVDDFAPRTYRMRFSLAAGGALAAVIALALFAFGRTPSAYAWQQMQANLAQDARSVQLRIQQGLLSVVNGTPATAEFYALYRSKTGVGSRLDGYQVTDGKPADSPSETILIHLDGSQEIIDYDNATLSRIRVTTLPPSHQPTKPQSVEQADAFIQALIHADHTSLEGEEQIDGQVTLRYTVPADEIISVSPLADQNYQTNVKVWIDAEKHLPVQWEIESKFDDGFSVATFDQYRRDEPIDDAVFELPNETAEWNRSETWGIYLSPASEMTQPLRIRVGLEGEQPWLTDADFHTEGERTEVTGQKLLKLTEAQSGKTLQVYLNDQLVTEHEIDWPVRTISILGPSYTLR